MQSKLIVKSRFFEPLAMVCYALLIAALLSFATNRYQKTDSTSIDAIRVATNQQVLKQCEDKKDSCLGAFVKFQDGWILLIENHAGISRAYSEIDRIDYIVYPNTQRWSGIAIDYARQFVRH